MMLRRAIRAVLVVDTSCQRSIAMSSSSRHGQPSAGAKKGTSNASNRVYVGGLPYKVTAREVRDHMMHAGHVVRVDFIRNSAGQRVGCGIVEFATASAAKDAIKLLHETRILDRFINVRADREAENLAIQPGSQCIQRPMAVNLENAVAPRMVARQEVPSLIASPPSTSARRDVLYVPPPVSNRICVENLDEKAKWITIQNHFKSAGTVTKVDISTAEGGKRPRHFVEFATAQEAARAAKRLNKSVVDGHKIAVYMVEPAKPDGR